MCSKDWLLIGTLSLVTTGRHACIQVRQTPPLFYMFGLSTCPLNYDGRLAAIPSNDFCLIINKVTPVDTISFHNIRSFQSMTLKSQDTYIPESHWWVTERGLARSSKSWYHSDKIRNFFAVLHHLRRLLDNEVSSSCIHAILGIFLFWPAKALVNCSPNLLLTQL